MLAFIRGFAKLEASVFNGLDILEPVLNCSQFSIPVPITNFAAVWFPRQSLKTLSV